MDVKLFSRRYIFPKPLDFGVIIRTFLQEINAIVKRNMLFLAVPEQ